jgi:hypothetical protein
MPDRRSQTSSSSGLLYTVLAVSAVLAGALLSESGERRRSRSPRSSSHPRRGSGSHPSHSRTASGQNLNAEAGLHGTRHSLNVHGGDQGEHSRLSRRPSLRSNAGSSRIVSEDTTWEIASQGERFLDCTSHVGGQACSMQTRSRARKVVERVVEDPDESLTIYRTRGSAVSICSTVGPSHKVY